MPLPSHVRCCHAWHCHTPSVHGVVLHSFSVPLVLGVLPLNHWGRSSSESQRRPLQEPGTRVGKLDTGLSVLGLTQDPLCSVCTVYADKVTCEDLWTPAGRWGTPVCLPLDAWVWKPWRWMLSGKIRDGQGGLTKVSATAYKSSVSSGWYLEQLFICRPTWYCRMFCFGSLFFNETWTWNTVLKENHTLSSTSTYSSGYILHSFLLYCLFLLEIPSLV